RHRRRRQGVVQRDAQLPAPGGPVVPVLALRGALPGAGAGRLAVLPGAHDAAAQLRPAAGGALHAAGAAGAGPLPAAHAGSRGGHAADGLLLPRPVTEESLSGRREGGACEAASGPAGRPLNLPGAAPRETIAGGSPPERLPMPLLLVVGAGL